MSSETITLEGARRVIAGAEKRAAQIDPPQNIAVVDSGGNLVAHARMDGAWIGSVEISINKAWTAQAFFAGGIPLTREGQVVGAVGVSGGDADQDQTVAEAAAAAL